MQLIGLSLMCRHNFENYRYGTDLMQRCTCEWCALESNPLWTRFSSIYHRMRVDAPKKYAQRKHSQQAAMLTIFVLNFYFIARVNSSINPESQYRTPIHNGYDFYR